MKLSKDLNGSGDSIFLVPADSLDSALPPGLSALCFSRRQPLGDKVRIYSVGDISLSGRIRESSSQFGIQSLLSEVAPFFKGGDIVFGNLESTLADSVETGALFAGSASDAAGLFASGFTLLHLANNHIYDRGPEGLMSTLSALSEAGIRPLGAGTDREVAKYGFRTKINGIRIAWLGCGRTNQSQNPDKGPVFWEFDEQELFSELRQVRQEADIIVVSIHIGLMYLDYPHPDHKAMAERLAAEGADVVLMHHAHVLQGVSVPVEGKVICYNLGNFLFDRCEGNIKCEVMPEEQDEGAVFLFDIDRGGVCLAAALPTVIDGECVVHWAGGVRGEKILSRLIRISEGLEKDYSRLFFEQRTQRNTRLAVSGLLLLASQKRWAELWMNLKRVRLEHVSMFIRWLISAPFPTKKG